jgi:hypothetical protein
MRERAAFCAGSTVSIPFLKVLPRVWCSQLSSGNDTAKKTRQLIEFWETPRRAFTKNVSIVSISLEQGDFLLFAASACTKPEEEP